MTSSALPHITPQPTQAQREAWKCCKCASPASRADGGRHNVSRQDGLGAYFVCLHSKCDGCVVENFEIERESRGRADSIEEKGVNFVWRGRF